MAVPLAGAGLAFSAVPASPCQCSRGREAREGRQMLCSASARLTRNRLVRKLGGRVEPVPSDAEKETGGLKASSRNKKDEA